MLIPLPDGTSPYMPPGYEIHELPEVLVEASRLPSLWQLVAMAGVAVLVIAAVKK